MHDSASTPTNPAITAGTLETPSSAVDEARAALARAHPAWDRAHTLAALAFAVGLALPVTPLELAGVPLMAVAFLRLRQTAPLYGGLVRHPVMLLMLLFAGWCLLAIAWSPDPAHGFDEVGSVRWLWVPVALWPVLDRRRALLVAIGAGMLLLHASQVTQALALRFGWDGLDFDRYPDRISGWTAPVVAGSILTGVLGLHAGPAVLARGRVAWIARAMVVITGVGVVATGTRGAWIASAGVLALAGVTALAVRGRSFGRRSALAGLALACVVGAAGWLIAGDEVRSRVVEARQELRGAIEGGDYSTSTGGRLIMWVWAGEAARTHPIVGVGTGGYQRWVEARQMERGIDPATQRVLAHAHGSFIHILATQGVVGLGLFVAASIVTIRHARPAGDAWASHEAGLPLAVAGVLLAGVFDSVHINAQSSALLATLAALAMRSAR
ncbi:MAG: O-antigen ligase family protein [Phycisphaerales bacterium]